MRLFPLRIGQGNYGPQALTLPPPDPHARESRAQPMCGAKSGRSPWFDTSDPDILHRVRGKSRSSGPLHSPEHNNTTNDEATVDLRQMRRRTRPRHAWSRQLPPPHKRHQETLAIAHTFLSSIESNPIHTVAIWPIGGPSITKGDA